MGLMAYIHACLDFLLTFGKIVKNREIGWLTVDRKTGKYMREVQPISKKIKLLLLFNPVLEWIDRTRALRFFLHEKATHAGKEESAPKSKKQIKGFVDFYNIDMSLFEPSDINEYPNFQEFFIRKHKEGTRPIHAADDDTKAVCAADCRLVVYDSVPKARSIWIKGKHFTISNLIGENQQHATPWHNGPVASFRLSPQDYHRFHSPVTGTILWSRHLSGDYYAVDPICIRSDIDVLTSNARSAVAIDSPEFGRVLFVAIGAKEVGTVKIHDKYLQPGAHIRKGDELGMFEFGGSSIILAFQPGRIEFDQDLLDFSVRSIEVDVEYGMSLGTASKGGSPGAGGRGNSQSLDHGVTTGAQPVGYEGVYARDVSGTGSEADTAGHGGRQYREVI